MHLCKTLFSWQSLRSARSCCIVRYRWDTLQQEKIVQVTLLSQLGTFSTIWSFTTGLLESWRSSRQEARIGQVPQWARSWYLPPERDSSWVESGPKVRKLCLPTDRPPGSGRRQSNLVRGGIGHHVVPVWGLQHLEATAIHLLLAIRPVKLVAAYLSPKRPLIESGLSECLSRGFPVLTAGDPNAKHTDRNSGPATAKGSHLHYYVNSNFCMIYGSDSPHHSSLCTQWYPRRPWYRDRQGLRPTGASDSMLCTQVGSATCPVWHHVSIISKPTAPPQLHANGLGRIPGLPRRQTSRESRGDGENALWAGRFCPSVRLSVCMTHNAFSLCTSCKERVTNPT
jgi:hypothetical protein